MADTNVLHHLADDLTGRRYGRLTALVPTGTRKNRYLVWTLKCDCGRMVDFSTQQLTHGRADCGCERERIRRRQKHPDYQLWYSMLKRCANTKHHRYGGRGISVCERWRDFDNFVADMGPRPSPQHSLDRIDNDGNYERGNCRWATETEQKRNFSRNRLITYRGKTRPLIAWCEIVGLSEKTLRSRIANGWDIDRAMSTPQQQRRK